jgi:hypothetical protein
MWVKDIKTGEVADLDESVVKAWPGGYVPAERPKNQKPSSRAASSVSASSEASKKENTNGS